LHGHERVLRAKPDGRSGIDPRHSSLSRCWRQSSGHRRHVWLGAQRKGCTASQLALAWVLAQGQDIVPIPGTKQAKFVDENLAAADIVLTPEDLRAIDAVLPAGSAAGDRYNAQAMAAVNR